MSMYRVFTGSDGEIYTEEMSLEERPEVGELPNLFEVRAFDDTRIMDFHPLAERRLIIHLTGEVEIGTSDSSTRIFRNGDIQLMEHVSGPGHRHLDRSPTRRIRSWSIRG